MEIDREIVAFASKPPNQCEVGAQASWGMRAGGDDDLVEMRIGTDDGRGLFFDDIRNVGVRIVPADGANGGRRKYDIAD